MKDMQTEQLLCWSGMTDAENTVQHLTQTKKSSLAFDSLTSFFGIEVYIFHINDK